VTTGVEAPVGVLVVDDSAAFRLAAAAVLARTPGFRLAGHAVSAEEALDVVAVLLPDLVLLDVRLPGMSGVDAAPLLRATAPHPVVVLCSTYARTDLPPGADGPYLHKEELRPAALRSLWEAARR
jgi:DNA-binding NarL/FixJ family response regulator